MEFIMMVGLPGSGKSTLANSLKDSNTVVLSSDAIRQELYGDEGIPGDSSKVFKILEDRLIESLTNGKNVVYDATNMTANHRRDTLK